AVRPEREDVDAVRALRRRGRLAGEAAAQRFPIVPRGSVPVAVTKLTVVVDGEEFALSAITPRRDGSARDERAAERDPVSYLMRPCFLSQSRATSFGSFLSTATSLFMPFSSSCESFALMLLSSFLIVPSSFARRS